MEMIHVMTRHPKTIHPDDTLAKAREIMGAAGFWRLPVVKGDQVVGMLTERDLRAHAGYGVQQSERSHQRAHNIGGTAFDGSRGHALDAAASDASRYG